ncbi:hypothetical protein [Curtobacterium sp. ISL-83]|uniref:hypothetical protein n=1 Tax=Curtobacterium sp. ISL-83 TaxID=2819145 RepID=UPI001BE87149|nr:hypothetical protein [Curtobacterium sp. ISL-83]MBT2503496.1 hypothetical protein [Curtobacterium sp. ISL-83]
MSTDAETLATVDAAVLAVPGVAELYRARPTVESAITAARGLVRGAGAPRVVLDDDVLRVVIGTDGVLPAPETARAAHLAALAAATAGGLVVARADVRVARVG